MPLSQETNENESEKCTRSTYLQVNSYTSRYICIYDICNQFWQPISCNVKQKTVKHEFKIKKSNEKDFSFFYFVFPSHFEEYKQAMAFKVLLHQEFRVLKLRRRSKYIYTNTY